MEWGAQMNVLVMVVIALLALLLWAAPYLFLIWIGAKILKWVLAK